MTLLDKNISDKISVLIRVKSAIIRSALIQRTHPRKISAITFLLAVAFLFSPVKVSAVTEFVSIVDTGPSGDYSTLSSWEQFNQTNLTLATTQVFSGTRTNPITDNDTLYLCRSGVYQTHTGRLVHATATQALLDTITGAATEQANDIWYTNNSCSSSNYFTLSGAQAGGDSAISVASCQASAGGADQTAVTIEGWDTSAANYIKVYTTQANRHDGKWNTGKYRLEVSNNWVSLEVNEDNVRLEGLQVKNSYGSNLWAQAIYLHGTGEFRVNNNILQVASSLNNATGLETDVAGCALKAWNNVIYGVGATGASSKGIRVYRGDGDLYNNTVYGFGGRGIVQHDDTVVVKNCAVFNNGDDFYGTITVTYSASDDSQAGTGNIQWTSGATDWANVFVNYANGDFHLSNFTGTGAIMDQGDDLTAEGFSDDIDSETRANHTWDIGADEAAEKIYRSVGPSASSAIDSNSSPGTNTIAITSGAAAFAEATATNVGVGDVILYDSNDSGTLTSADSIAFIKSRTDNQNYVIQTETGATPSDMPTPNDTWAIYRAYTSLSNAESGTVNSTLNALSISYTGGDRDLVANNEQWNIACYANGSTADGTAVTITGWTTSAANYIKIYTPTETTEVGVSQRHSGVWDSGKYRLVYPTGNNYAVTINENYVKITGIQIENSCAKASIPLALKYDSPGAGEIIVEGCIFRASGTGTADLWARAIGDSTNGSATIVFRNNVLYDYGYGIHFESNVARTIKIYNNTFADCAVYGINTGLAPDQRTNYIKNNIVQNCSTDYTISVWETNYTATNISSDTSSPDGASYRNITSTFVDSANDDYHLASEDTDAIDAGTDLTTEGGFTDDIDGDTRPSPYWDIGADEYPAKQKAKFKGKFRFKGEIRIK